MYLNDSEGVVFSHVGGNNRAVTRPAVKAGAIRIAAGPEEHHTAENTSSTASDFLRIVFKTDNAGDQKPAAAAGHHRCRVGEQADEDHAAAREAGSDLGDRIEE